MMQQEERKFRPKPGFTAPVSNGGAERKFTAPNVVKDKKRDLSAGYGIIGKVYGDGKPVKNVQPIATYTGGQQTSPPAAGRTFQPKQTAPPLKKYGTTAQPPAPQPYNLYDPNGPEATIQKKMGEAAGILTGHSKFIDKRAADTVQALREFPGPTPVTASAIDKPPPRVATKYTNDVGHPDSFKMVPPNLTMPDKASRQFSAAATAQVLPGQAMTGEQFAPEVQPETSVPQQVWDAKRQGTPLHNQAVARKQDKDQLKRATNIHAARQFQVPGDQVANASSPTVPADGFYSNPSAKTIPDVAGMALDAGSRFVQSMGLQAGPTIGQENVMSFPYKELPVGNLADGADGGRKFMPKINPQDRAAYGAANPNEERLVGGNMPVFTPPKKDTGGKAVAATAPAKIPGNDDAAITEPTVTTTQGPDMPKMTRGQGIGVNMSASDQAIKQSIADIDNKIAQGFAPSPEEAARIQQIKRQAGFLRGGTDRVPVGPDGLPLRKMVPGAAQKVGNMDVQFDKSVDPSAQQRFMSAGSGVNPQAQPTWADDARQFKNRSIAGQFGGGRSLSGPSNRQAEPGAINTFGDVMREKHRMAVNKQNEASRNNAENLRLENQKNQAALSLGIDRNAIDAANVAGQNQERQSQIANNQFTLNQAQQLAKVQEMYINEQDPNKKKALERQLYALGGKQQPKQEIFSEKSIDPVTGEPVTVNYSRDAEGNISRLIPPQFPDIPSSKKELVKGQVYQTNKGLGRWEGERFRRMELDQLGNARPTQ